MERRRVLSLGVLVLASFVNAAELKNRAPRETFGTAVNVDALEDSTLINAILDMFARKGPDIFEAQLTALLNRPDAGMLMSQIHCPTLILCGRQDAWSPLEWHEAMAREIPGATLAAMDRCGHMSTMERPAEVSAALREWLTT